MDRRAFLQLCAGMALVPHTPVPTSHDGLDRIGIQLYTVRTLLRDDFEGTLARIAAIGYREVEFAGYFDRGPALVKSALVRAGLTAPGTHLPLADLRDDPDRTLASAASIGHHYVVVAWIPAEERRTRDAWKRLADDFNRIGERCRGAGLQFAYHNHDYEFVPLAGRLPFDLLLGGTDPTLVQLEIDLYWITKGGQDPLRYFAEYPGRITLVHVKDSAGAPEHRMVDVGRGAIDWPRIFARRAQAGIRHVFVEHDQPSDPLAFARASYEYLKRLEF
ncbi:MAG: sugar phosphate isomerase/epimerase family protein [Gemmatimonadales bacterium]